MITDGVRTPAGCSNRSDFSSGPNPSTRKGLKSCREPSHGNLGKGTSLGKEAVLADAEGAAEQEQTF